MTKLLLFFEKPQRKKNSIVFSLCQSFMKISVRNISKTSLLILELQVDFEETENGLLIFIRYGFALR